MADYTVGAYGDDLTFDVGEDFTGYTELRLVFESPSGDQTTLDNTTGGVNDGGDPTLQLIHYTTIATTWAEDGKYEVWWEWDDSASVVHKATAPTVFTIARETDQVTGAFSLVATVGASTSNSYVTVAEADDYFLAHPKHETWDAYDTETKERNLILATRLIDQQNIDGEKNDTSTTSGVPDQALKFPRAEDVDDSAEFIPVKIKEAAYLQALSSAEGGTSSTRSDLQAAGVVEVELGDGTREKYSGEGGTSSVITSEVAQLMARNGFIACTGSWA